MQILIVEDDSAKLGHVDKCVRSICPSANVDHAKSYKSGLRSVMEIVYDLIILDMSLPNFDITSEDDGGRPLPYAGKEILRQLSRRGMPSKVFIVTQFETFGSGADALDLEQLVSQIRDEFSGNYIGHAYFSASSEVWKESLRDAFRIVGGVHD